MTLLRTCSEFYAPDMREIAGGQQGNEDLTLSRSAELAVVDVERLLGVSLSGGLASDEARRRRVAIGANVLRSHGAGAWPVFMRQLRNPLLVLLFAAAALSLAVGDRTDAGIVFFIVALSVVLGFTNEYRSERAVEALHDAIRHLALVTRDGHRSKIEVTELVPGDVVHLSVGDIVPADMRITEADSLECDEAVLTGESLPVVKDVSPAAPGAASLSCCVYMGTVVRSGAATAVVVTTGRRTAFGEIAAQLGDRQPQTAFQLGLADFSRMLVNVAGVLCAFIFVVNLAARHSFLETLLFSLAIAVGITPQLLPAIVTVSLSAGARRLAKNRVVVKRLVTIEDLGNIEVLFTDKTGTLTEGNIGFTGGVNADGKPDDDLLFYGLVCNDAVIEGGHVVGGNALDTALWKAGFANRRPYSTDMLPTLKSALPFDHDRQLASVLVDNKGDAEIVTKGAPESVLARCADVPPAALTTLDTLFARGTRVIAVATKNTPATARLTIGDEQGLSFRGFLTFADPPKRDARASLERLANLGVTVKVITGDSAVVASHVCDELGLPPGEVLTGAQLEKMSDDELKQQLPSTRLFARVSPDQKSRIIRSQRTLGADVAFMGDGVNDAVALHDADVGISVEGATEVATDAADIVLLAKDLGVLADGVVEGRRIFANTIKYVLMATSSNFGNMFSAAGASAFLSYLPMLPGQILLNNLLYDLSQTAIPGDRVDPEQLQRPSAWDIHFIRRFMATFGPISSIFDFTTFGVMLWVLHASTDEFRSGWFVESLATQTLVIFVIRTRRLPFWRSRPGIGVGVGALTCAAVGVYLPFSPFAGALGFSHLPAEFMAIVAVMVVVYLTLCELAKSWFYSKRHLRKLPLAAEVSRARRRIHRRSSRFSTKSGS